MPTDVVVHANNAASQMLGIPSKSIMGKKAAALLSMPSFLSKAVSQRTPLIDVEGIIQC